MKRVFYLMLSCTLAICSCTGNQDSIIDSVVEESTPLVISAVADSLEIQEHSTRAYGSFTYKILWQEGDCIIAEDESHTFSEFTLIEGAGKQVGKFQKTDDSPITGKITAYYPKSLRDNNSFVWPSTQEYSASSTRIVGMPMICKDKSVSDSGTDMVFSGLGSVLQVIVSATAPGVELNKVVLEELEGKGLSGVFEIENGVITRVEGGTKIEMNFDGLNISNSIATFSLSLPPITDGKFKLTMFAKDGRKDEILFDATFRASTIRKLHYVADGFEDVLAYTKTDGTEVKLISASGFESVTYETFGKHLENTGAGEPVPVPIDIVNVSLPSSTRFLGDMTFHGESHLNSVNLNDGLETIGEYCFEDCVELTRIDIPSSVLEIGDHAFNNCVGITTFIFRGSEPPTFGEAVFAFGSETPLIFYAPDDDDIQNLYYDKLKEVFPDDEIEIKGLSELEE